MVDHGAGRDAEALRDFRGAAGSPQKYIAKYAADPAAAKLLAADGFKVEWIDYDWTLNGAPPRR